MKSEKNRAARSGPAHKLRNTFNLAPVAALLLIMGGSPVRAADGFSPLAPLTNDTDSYAYGVSGDGSVVAGYSSGDGGPQAVTWDASGTTGLGGFWSTASAISYDGSTVVGGFLSGFYTHAFRWTAGGGLVDLGTLGGHNSNAYGVSADGSVVVGASNNTIDTTYSHAFRWSGGSMTDLGTLGGNNSYAYGVSGNGTVVVGDSDILGGAIHAFRWQQGATGGVAGNAQMFDLGTLGGTNSHANGISTDGTVVVGYADTAGGASHAYRWVSGATGGVSGNVQMYDLGILSGGTYSQADAVSGDGKVVVGKGDNASGSDTAFRWTQSTGMQSVVQWLAAANVSVPAGLSLYEATGTNGDGSVVVGNATTGTSHNEAWIARVSAFGNGLISVPGYTQTLARNGDVPHMGIDLATLTFFGVHHRPLMDSGMPAGQCGWVTVDAGHSDTYDTDRQLTEVGACRDLADKRWRVGAGLGASWSRQGFSYGGVGKYQGNYLYTEADYAPESRRWIASVSAMYSRWNTTIARGYLNGASNDQSTGSPDATGWSLRARMDWKNLARLGAFSVSPFATVTHIVSHLDAYTETGGGFPARFNAQDWRTDELRVGTVLQKALSPATDLRLNLEAANRLDGSGPGVSGQVLGLFSFSYAGTDVKRTWLRAMAEVDHRLSDKSLISANLNAATSGNDPTWGGSIGYKRAF